MLAVSNNGHSMPLAFFQYVLACTSKSILPKTASCKKKSPLCEKLNLLEISLRFQLYWVSHDAAVWTSSKKGLEAI